MKHILCALLATLAVPTIARSDAMTGAELAGEHCARCHDIAPGGAAKQHPPSFASIAGYRAEDQIVARIMFPDLHSSMPAWSQWLSRDDVDDLVAFILSLEGS